MWFQCCIINVKHKMRLFVANLVLLGKSDHISGSCLLAINILVEFLPETKPSSILRRLSRVQWSVLRGLSTSKFDKEVSAKLVDTDTFCSMNIICTFILKIEGRDRELYIVEIFKWNLKLKNVALSYKIELGVQLNIWIRHSMYQVRRSFT